MKDIIRSISLKALKRFANGGDGHADLLMQIEDLQKTLEIRTPIPKFCRPGLYQSDT